MDKVELGDKVKDKVTGFEGIVIGQSQWLNKSSTSGVQSTTLENGVPVATQWFDDPRLEIIEISFSMSMGFRQGR